MISITLDDVNINTGNTTVRTVQHDSMPQIVINSLKPTREDGEKLINVKLGSKIITIEGTVKASDQDTFEDTLDTLKKNFNVERKNLDIEYAGATRRYAVTLRSFTTARNFFNVSFINYSATFLVETGYGTDTDITQSATGNALDDTLTTMAVNFEGTHTPYPTARFVLDDAGNLDTIQYKSVGTGQQIEVGTAWSDGDVILIDSESRTLSKNGSFIDFSGEFPRFVRGDDTIQLNITTTDGGIDQSNETVAGGRGIGEGTPDHAQSFKPSDTTTYSKVDLYLAKDLDDNPSYEGNLTVSLQADSAGDPDGSDIAGTSVTINHTSISESGGWVTFNFTSDASLISGNTYWIVISSTNTLGQFNFDESRSNNYTDGTLKQFINPNWSEITDNDALFKVYKSETPTYSIDFKQTYIKKYL